MPVSRRVPEPRRAERSDTEPLPDPRPPPSALPGPTRPVGAVRGQAVPSRAVPEPPRPGEVPAPPVPPAAPPLCPARPCQARLGSARPLRDCAERSVLLQKETRRTSRGAPRRSRACASAPERAGPSALGHLRARSIERHREPSRHLAVLLGHRVLRPGPAGGAAAPRSPTRPGGIAAPRRCPRPPSKRGCPGLRALRAAAVSVSGKSF